MRLPPGHYIVTADPRGPIAIFGVRFRVLTPKTTTAEPSRLTLIAVLAAMAKGSFR